MIATAITKQLLAADATLPQRDTLLNEGLMMPRLAEAIGDLKLADVSGCQIERVKYRFGESLRVLFDLRCGNETIKVAARTFDAARLTEMRSAKKVRMIGTAKSMPDFIDEQLQTAFWIFPNDRKLSSLDVFTTVPENLARVSDRLWKGSELAAYAPEKCATLRCRDENGETIAYAKIFVGDEGRRIYEIYKSFVGAKIRLPSAIAYSDVHRTLILEAIHGTRVADLSPEVRGGVYHRLGAVLAEFHQVDSFHGLRWFKRLSPKELSGALQTIANAVPEHAFQAARILEKLSTFSYEASPDICLHGDLHEKNVIWKNGELTLIDLDQVSIGDAGQDIGSFLAGLRYKECTGHLSTKCRVDISKEFLDGYASVHPLPSDDALRRHTAAALFVERALRAVTRYRVEGLANIGLILAAAESILSGGDL